MRPTASIVIPAWNEWELTRACLESLRPTMKGTDQVVVVDNGSTDGTAAGLARYGWVTVLTQTENLGFAGGCNAGASVATGDVVVFLNNDTLVPARWLDGLLAPFADETVGATGPRSNFVSGPQVVPDVPYDARRLGQVQAFARAWRQRHSGQTTEVLRLVGFCLAVRRDLFEGLGGFDEGFGLGGCEDDDLCLRLSAGGHRLLITHDTFVHHHGHRTFEGNGVDWFDLQQSNAHRLRTKHDASLDGHSLEAGPGSQPEEWTERLPDRTQPGSTPAAAGQAARRGPATVLVNVNAPWSITRRCLESLRPTLRVRDEVVVLEPGGDAVRSSALRACSWLRVLPASADRSWAATSTRSAREVVAQEAKHALVVLLDSDTLVTAHWLDAVLSPMVDETVAAVGARTNYASGTQQLACVPYGDARLADVQRFARERREQFRSRCTSTALLEGFCLALRRSDLDSAGARDDILAGTGHETTDLSLRLTRGGRRLVIAEDAFVHRHGVQEDGDPAWLSRRQTARERLAELHGERARAVPTDVLLSACLIVKDEQERLPDCLASLHGLVDEIVVYDTGSTDKTVAIARAAGALVVEGFWDDDFSRARNAALSQCSGQWILHVYADDVVEGPAAEIRSDLEGRLGQDAVHVRIDNLDDHGSVARSHHAARLFRRLRGHWQGHLHDQIVPRSGAPLRPPVGPTPMVLRHVGYMSGVVDAQDKRERNLRVAQEGVHVSGAPDPQALVNLGRALVGAGRHAEALQRFAEVRTVTRESAYLRYALRHGAELLISEDRGAEALEWVEALRAHTASTTVPDYLAGLAQLSLGDTDAALRLFEGLDELSDEQSTLPRHVILSRRGLTYVAAGRYSEATTELLAAAQATRAWAALWGPLVGSCWNSGRPMSEAVELVSDGHLLSVLAHSMNLTPEISDALAEQFWARWPQDPRLLAYASRIACRLALPRALEWSARLRSAGLDECPVLALAEDVSRDPVDRLRAAAVGVEVFGDDRCSAALGSAAGDVAPARFLEALSAVDELSPRQLGGVVVGAATTPDRAAAMAGVLRAVGADEQADALLLASA